MRTFGSHQHGRRRSGDVSGRYRLCCDVMRRPGCRLTSLLGCWIGSKNWVSITYKPVQSAEEQSWITKEEVRAPGRSDNIHHVEALNGPPEVIVSCDAGRPFFFCSFGPEDSFVNLVFFPMVRNNPKFIGPQNPLNTRGSSPPSTRNRKKRTG